MHTDTRHFFFTLNFGIDAAPSLYSQEITAEGEGEEAEEREEVKINFSS